MFTQFDHEIPLVLWLKIAIVVVAADIYLFVPPPGRGQPTFRMLLIALAVAFAGLAAIGIIEKLIGGFDFSP